MIKSVRYVVLLSGSAMLASCLSTPPADDPVLIKLTELEDRISRAERVVANESLVGLQSQIDQMRTELRELRGQAEQLQFQNQEVAKRQRTQYVDIDTRMQKLEQGGARYPAVGQGGAGSASDGDRQAYDSAFEALKNGRYNEAITGFQGFSQDYAGSPLADNATYWLGEAYYVTADFPSALGQFEKLVTRYPSSTKLSDAMLKIGYCHYEMKSYEAARAILESVVGGYPDTTAGRLATERLDKMTGEGR